MCKYSWYHGMKYNKFTTNTEELLKNIEETTEECFDKKQYDIVDCSKTYIGNIYVSDHVQCCCTVM